jgi:hypothetical protein
MKKIYLALPLVLSVLLISCGGGTKEAKTADATTEAGKTDAPAAAAAPKTMITEADWSETDLSTVSPMVPVSMKTPKDAKMEKNGNGGTDIRINPVYLITVGPNAVSNAKEAIEDAKHLTINNKTYKNGKVISEEANGFVYSMQMNDEANGTKYEPEAHFFYVIEKGGAFYTIQDARPMDNFSLPGSAYSEEVATKLFNIVKSSAKVK